MNHRHFMIYKPYGFLSQFVYQKKRKKRLLGELCDFPDGTMSIGRLDEDSEGLLLLTTDGRISEIVRSSKIEKEYLLLVDGIITETAVGRLMEGVEIGVKGERYTTKPCVASIPDVEPVVPYRKVRDLRHGPVSWVRLTLTEGKFRQARKMLAAVGFPVLRLIRIRIGKIHIVNMSPGDVVEIDADQIIGLKTPHMSA